MTQNDGSLSPADRFDRLEAKIDVLTDEVRKAATQDSADKQTLENHDARIAALEAWQTWAMRLILGAVITGFIAIAWNAG